MFIDWISWLHSSVEWLGWNDTSIRISFLATLPLTIIEMWAIRKQDVLIEKNKSGESVSVSMFVYFTCLFVAFGYFGTVVHSIATVFNGFISLFYMKMAFTLWKTKGFSKAEEKRTVMFAIFAMCVVALPTMRMKELAMTLMMLGALYPIWLQLKELKMNKRVGSLDMRLLLIFFISTSFWTVYAFSTHNVPLMWVNPPVLVLQILLIFYWFKFREPYGTSRIHLQ